MISNSEPNPIPFAPMTKKERGRRAYQLLRAVREAIAALRAQCPSKERVKKTVNEVCRQTARMLGLSPGPAPSDAASQEELVETAGKMAGLLRAYNWADCDIAATDARTTAQAPHAGESGAADGFDAASKLTLTHASPEGWTSELFTSAAKGDTKSELAVKIAKYLLHPTPLLILNDLTQMCGRAIYSSHVNKLSAYVSDLHSLMKDPTDDSKWPSPDPEVSLDELLGLGGVGDGPELEGKSIPPGEVPPLDDVSTPLNSEPGSRDVSVFPSEGLDDSTSLTHDNQYETGTDCSKTALSYLQSYSGQKDRARRRRQFTPTSTPPAGQPTTETQNPMASSRTSGRIGLRKASPRPPWF